MASVASAAAAAAATIAVLAVMVLSSQGHQVTGPFCSDCGLLCTMNCTNKIYDSCSGYCTNPVANTQYCQRQVFQACTLLYCCYGNCSFDCNSAAQTCNVHGTMIDCENCKGGILQYCIPDCMSNCNTTCVKKDHGC